MQVVYAERDSVTRFSTLNFFFWGGGLNVLFGPRMDTLKQFHELFRFHKVIHLQSYKFVCPHSDK